MMADGPPGAVPVLLLHGVTWTAALNFHQVVGALAARHPVIAIEHRGHGGGLAVAGRLDMATLADDAAALLDELGVERAIVVGFSLGTMTALHIGARHTHRVAGLVLSAGCLCFAERRRERVLLATGVPLMALAARLGLLNGLSARYFGANRSDPEFERTWSWVRAELARSPIRTVIPAIRAASVHDVRPDVERLRQVPSAVVVTRRDGLVPAARQRAMARALGAAQIEIDADHEAPLSHPGVYRDAIVQAVSTLLADGEQGFAAV
jgi:3-oxoadipate enol-lactonase